jgi:aryl-alcohol dehydrogenase-like predicted oxidoreductase
MRFRRLGKTDMKISVIGLGAWQAGFKSWGKDYSREDVINAINKALELGINFVDTAEIYGDGKSEELLGEVIGGNDEIFLATKVAGFNATPSRIGKSLEKSLNRLKRDCIDLYQIHWPPSVYTNLCKVFREVERLIDKGLIRYIGVSNFSKSILEKAVNCMRRYEIVSNQVQYNLLYRAAEKDLIPFMRDNNIELIAWSPLAKGALAGKLNADSWARKMDKAFKRARDAKDLFEELGYIADKYNATLSQISLAWIVAKGGIPIPGVKKVYQAKLNAMAGDINLVDEDVKKLDEVSKVFVRGDIDSVMPRYIPNFFQRMVLRLLGGI